MNQPRRKTDWVFLSPFILFLVLPILGLILASNQEGECGFGPWDWDDHEQSSELIKDE